jgi:hypothetical protein
MRSQTITLDIAENVCFRQNFKKIKAKFRFQISKIYNF